jgi:hypothetical protein
MAAAQRAWPRGEVAPDTHAAIRSRRALARATTGVAIEGDDWCILGFHPEHALPSPLPRVAQLVAGGPEVLAPWTPHWSTLGADAAAPGLPAGVRVCRPGRMQRPPMERLHDGVDWLAWTRRPAG